MRLKRCSLKGIALVCVISNNTLYIGYVLVKCSIGIHLVNDIHITIPAVKVCLVVDEHIKVVTVLAELSTNVAVGIIHLLLPSLAVLIHTRAI